MTMSEADETGLQALLLGQKNPDSLTIDLSAAGGVTSERYNLVLSVTGVGQVKGRLFDEMRERTQEFEQELTPHARDALLRQLLEAGLLSAQSDTLRVPADTVMARVQFIIEGQTIKEFITPLDPDDVRGEKTSRMTKKDSQRVLDILIDLVPEPS